jgi:hypothetical protein
MSNLYSDHWRKHNTNRKWNWDKEWWIPYCWVVNSMVDWNIAERTHTKSRVCSFNFLWQRKIWWECERIDFYFLGHVTQLFCKNVILPFFNFCEGKFFDEGKIGAIHFMWGCIIYLWFRLFFSVHFKFIKKNWELFFFLEYNNEFFFVFYHRFNLVWGSVLTSSGFIPFRSQLWWIEP